MAADACASNVQELGRGAAVELRVRAQRHNNVCALLQRAGFICLCAHCDANTVDIGEECRHFDLALCVAAYNVLGVGCEGATESVQTVCMLRGLGVLYYYKNLGWAISKNIGNTFTDKCLTNYNIYFIPLALANFLTCCIHDDIYIYIIH